MALWFSCRHNPSPLKRATYGRSIIQWGAARGRVDLDLSVTAAGREEVAYGFVFHQYKDDVYSALPLFHPVVSFHLPPVLLPPPPLSLAPSLFVSLLSTRSPTLFLLFRACSRSRQAETRRRGWCGGREVMVLTRGWTNQPPPPSSSSSTSEKDAVHISARSLRHKDTWLRLPCVLPLSPTFSLLPRSPSLALVVSPVSPPGWKVKDTSAEKKRRLNSILNLHLLLFFIFFFFCLTPHPGLIRIAGMFA